MADKKSHDYTADCLARKPEINHPQFGKVFERETLSLCDKCQRYLNAVNNLDKKKANILKKQFATIDELM